MSLCISMGPNEVGGGLFREPWRGEFECSLLCCQGIVVSWTVNSPVKHPERLK